MNCVMNVVAQEPRQRGHLLIRPAVLIAAAFFLWLPAHAQNSQQGPLAPPPEHSVHRVSSEATPDAPLALPAEEVIKRFVAKEDENFLARPRYGYRKTLRIQEFGPDGQPSGEMLRVTEVTLSSDGKVSAQIIEKPQSTLKHIYLAPEDVAALDRMPAYVLTSSQLAKYDLKYLGKEQVDEIDCYIFQVKPKIVERIHAYFDGIVWVDAQYLEVVKTYGRWVTDQGDMRAMEQLPFTLFETYRENVDGKYWLPNYSRSDDTLHIKEGDFPMRVTIKWTDFKALSAATTLPPASASPAPPAKP
jgi:hypothetical protein